jgi:excisionase family DNA binding protein
MKGTTTSTQHEDALLNPEEFALRLGFSRETLRRKTRRGEIPVIRLSRNVLKYRESEIEKFLSSRTK